MSSQPTPELIPLTDIVSVSESQFLDNDLPQLTEINFLNGVIGVNGTPIASAIGLYATDVPTKRVKDFVDPDSEGTNSVDRLFSRAGVVNSDTCDTTVLQAWHTGNLTVIEPVSLPYAKVPEFVSPPGLVRDIFKILRSNDTLALHRRLNDTALDIQTAMRNFAGPLRLRNRAAAITLGFALFHDADTPVTIQAAQPGIPAASLYKLWPDLQPSPPATKVDIDTILTGLEARYIDPVEKVPVPALVPVPPPVPLLTPPSPRPSPTKKPRTRPPVARKKPPKKPEIAPPPQREVTPWQYDKAAGTAQFSLGETTITCRFDGALSDDDMSLLTRAWSSKPTRQGALPTASIMPSSRELLPIRRRLDDPHTPATPRELLCRHIQNGYVSFAPVTAETVSLSEKCQAILDLLLSGMYQSEICRQLSMSSGPLSTDIQNMKRIFGIPDSSDEMLIFAAYATGYRTLPKLSTEPFRPQAIAQEQNAEALITYPIAVREPATVSAAYPMQYKANRARTRYNAPVEEGDLIHWAGGVFRRSFPHDSSKNQIMSRALALYCFDLTELQIAQMFTLSEVRIRQYIKEAEEIYNLREGGLGSNIRTLFDREWLTVIQEVPIPDYRFHPRHVEVMQALHTARSVDEVGECLGLNRQGMSQLSAFCRNLIGVHNTRSILTLSYGMKFFLPERYYRETSTEPLSLARNKAAIAPEQQAQFEARKATARQSFAAHFTVPGSIQVIPGKSMAASRAQRQPPKLPRPVENGEYIHWADGVFKRNIDAEAFGLDDEAVRTLVLSGLGYTTDELALHYDGLESATTALAHAYKRTGLPTTELGLTRSLFAQKWLVVEEQMTLPDQAAYRIKLYEEDIDYLRLLRDATKLQDFTDAFGTSREHSRTRMRHLKKFFGVASMAGVLAAAHGTGLWLIGDTPEKIT